MQTAVLKYRDDFSRVAATVTAKPAARDPIVSSGTTSPFELTWSGSDDEAAASLGKIIQGSSANAAGYLGRTIEGLSTSSGQLGVVQIHSSVVGPVDYYPVWIRVLTENVEPTRYEPDNRFFLAGGLPTQQHIVPSGSIWTTNYFPIVLDSVQGSWIGPYNPSDDSSAAAPTQINLALEAIEQLQDGWDGYGATKIAAAVLKWMSEDLAGALDERSHPRPDVIPGADGSLQAEWHRKRGELTYNIDSVGDRYLWFRDRTTGEVIELFGEDARSNLSSSIARLVD